MEFNLRNISYKYSHNKEFASNGISVNICSNKVTGLAGANGSGKTTLIKILLGQLIDFTGDYFIDSKRITIQNGDILSEFKIGYGPDDVCLDDNLTGYEILQLVAELRDVSQDSFEEEFELFETALQLENWFKERTCNKYSTGMRRKTAIAIAFLGPMNFVILDEPTNGLDPLSVRGLKNLIRVKASKGCGCLVASHILDFVEKTVDECILLKNGKVCTHGSIDSIVNHVQYQSLEEVYYHLFSSEPGNHTNTK